MTQEQSTIIKYINDSLQLLLSHYIGESVTPNTMERIRFEMEDYFRNIAPILQPIIDIQQRDDNSMVLDITMQVPLESTDDVKVIYE